MPLFNSIADKKMILAWSNAYFWMAGFTFTLITGLREACPGKANPRFF
jgi:putative ABC transport system permease protein